jgi:hypothetical protein
MTEVQLFNRAGGLVATVMADASAEIIGWMGTYYALTAGRYVESKFAHASAISNKTLGLVETQVQIR